MSHSDLSGHVALVTGANHGIGASTTEELARRGAAVVATYLRAEPIRDPGLPASYDASRSSDASRVVETIHREGGRVLAVETDLTEPGTIPALFDRAEEAWGLVDILVHNASGWLADTFRGQSVDRFGRRLRRVSAETFDRQFAVDARAGALLIAEFARRHERSGTGWGRIVCLSSGGSEGFPEEVSYGAAKAALENYTMSAATELLNLGITANVLRPPVTDTGWISDAFLRVLRAGGVDRIAPPAEVAEVVAALVSEQTGWVTGNIVRMR